MTKAKQKSKTQKELKTYYLGVKITKTHQEMLEKRRQKEGDESLAHTARRILIRDLEAV